jgi:hypothetical protein
MERLFLCPAAHVSDKFGHFRKNYTFFATSVNYPDTIAFRYIWNILRKQIFMAV